MFTSGVLLTNLVNNPGQAVHCGGIYFLSGSRRFWVMVDGGA
jgi:hypothetical protein